MADLASRTAKEVGSSNLPTARFPTRQAADGLAAPVLGWPGAGLLPSRVPAQTHRT
jgi:hypothetical protein